MTEVIPLVAPEGPTIVAPNELSLEEFTHLLYPSMRKIQWEPNVEYRELLNNIIWNCILVVGKQFAGKSMLVMKLAELAHQAYGSSEFAGYNMEKWIGPFLDDPFLERKRIQLLFFDDLNGIKLSKTQCAAWTDWRHIMKQFIGSRNGLINMFMAGQRYFGIDKTIRESINGMIVKAIPFNPYDASMIKRYIGEQAYNFLCAQQRLVIHEDIMANEYAAFNIAGIQGTVRLPAATHNYLNTWEHARARYGRNR